MKIKSIIYNFLFILIFLSNSISDEILFESSNLNILEDGNIIKAYKGRAIFPADKIEIEGDDSTYDKEKTILTVIKNVKFYDRIKNVYLEGEKLIYNQKTNIVHSEGETFIKVEDKYEINSKNLYYDRNTMNLYSKKETIVKDDKKNVFNFENGFIFEVNKEIISAERSSIVDNQNNNYLFDNVKINLKTDEIVGKEVRVDFIDNYFGNDNNDPILKGKSTVSNEKETRIYKAVFSTCNIENKNCRGWELQSEEFNHNKINQTFEYTNSWLKMFGKKFLFFPYFSHPDPSVKRKSGFLTPSYSNSDNIGFFVNVPYFKVLSADKDMTFNPRLWADDKFIMQAEYRQALENSIFISDFSFNHDGTNTNTHFFSNLEGRFNDTTTYDFQFQNVSNDNYLKIYGLDATSPIIESVDVLTTHFTLDKEIDDQTKLYSSFRVYEDLSKLDNDRYQFIFPDFSFNKKIDIDDDYNGNFKFISTGFQKHYDTNKHEVLLNNDFLFESNDKIFNSGLITDYDFLIKNFNTYAENSSSYDEKNDHEIFGTVLFNTGIPLKKSLENSTNLIKPMISARYSPNSTKDISGNNTRLNYNNAFAFNRIGTSDMVEGGKSLSLGVEYEKLNSEQQNIFNFKLANVLRDKKNENLPKKSSFNQTRSDIVGNLSYKPNDIWSIDYDFSYDRDLDYSNFESITTNFSVNNFVTKFNYVTENHEGGNSETLSNETSYNINKEHKLSFITAKDLIADFTEYYNLVYAYETDCLIASFEYNKKFYRDGSLVPDQSLTFFIRYIPFTEIRGTADTLVKRFERNNKSNK
mgnify:CR=1 FL=1